MVRLGAELNSLAVGDTLYICRREPIFGMKVVKVQDFCITHPLPVMAVLGQQICFLPLFLRKFLDRSVM